MKWHIGPGYEFRAEAIRFEPLKKNAGENASIFGVFWVILGLGWGPLWSQISGVASLDVVDIR